MGKWNILGMKGILKIQMIVCVCVCKYEHDRMRISAWWNWCSQFCSQQLQSTILVPELSPFFGAKDADSCWFVEKIDSCLHLVDILACMMIMHRKGPNEDFSFLCVFSFPSRKWNMVKKITRWIFIF